MFGKPDFSSFKPRKSYAVNPKSEGERIPPKSLGSAVPDPHALLQQYKCSSTQSVVLKSTPGIITDEPAPSIMMEAQIDGHTYKGALYLAEGEKERPISPLTGQPYDSEWGTRIRKK